MTEEPEKPDAIEIWAKRVGRAFGFVALGCSRALSAADIRTAMSDTAAKPGGWTEALAPSLDDLEALAVVAFAALPDEFRRLTGEVPIQVAEFPGDRRARRSRYRIGIRPARPLFRQSGSPMTRRLPRPGGMPNMIWLYRRPILDYWAEHEETLGAIVTHVLVHEIGHHFGLSDDDMEAIEAAGG